MLVLFAFPPGFAKREREAEEDKVRIDAIDAGGFPLPDLVAMRSFVAPVWVSGSLETADLSNKPTATAGSGLEAIDA